MDGITLNNEIKRLKDALNTSIDKLFENGKAKALAERNYDVLVAKKVYQLKDSGMPMAQIEKVVKGDEEVADAKEKFRLAEVLYDVGREKIMAVKKQLDIVHSQWQYEWSNAGRRQ
jgi:hypothetical protein